jgi:hypothetical protein
LVEIALLLDYKRRHNAAVALIQQAIRFYKGDENHYAEANAYHWLSFTRLHQNDFQEAQRSGIGLSRYESGTAWFWSAEIRRPLVPDCHKQNVARCVGTETSQCGESEDRFVYGPGASTFPRQPEIVFAFVSNVNDEMAGMGLSWFQGSRSG